MDQPYLLLANTVLALHFAIVIFVVGGLAFILVGRLCAWRWVDALWFRLAHLGAIAVVAAQAWAGVVCPLTTLEMWLRERAGAATYEQSFIEYWMQRLLYYEAPAWVFALAYTVFLLVVLATWVYIPPRHKRKHATPGKE